MRKIVKVFIALIMIITLASCKTPNELTDFSSAFKGYDFSKTTGYRYSKIQKLDNIAIYEEVIDVKINRENPLVAHKYYYLRELKEFNLESQFSEEIFNEYYYKDSIGIIVDDELVWEKKAFSLFVENMSLPNFKFKKEYLGEHTLTKLADYLLLRTEIKDEYTKEFFMIEEDIKDIFFEARIKGKKLQEFKIIYTLNKTTVETSYRIYYDKHELNISND